MLTIKKVENGYIIESENPNAEGRIETVFEFTESYDDRCLTERKALQRLLWFVADWSGDRGGKHDKFRVFVEIKDQSGEEIE